MITTFSILGPVAFILLVVLGVPVAYEFGFRRGRKRGAAEGRREGRSHERRAQALRRLKSGRSWSFTTRLVSGGDYELIFGEDPGGTSWIARRWSRSLSVTDVREAVTGRRATTGEDKAFEAAFHAHLALRPSDGDWSDAEGDQPQ